MKKLLLFTITLIGLYCIQSNAQSVIISEFNLVTVTESYLELCNVGDTTEDLSNYILLAGYNGSGWRTADQNPRRSWPLLGKLEPGETWVATRDRHEVNEFGDTIHFVNPWLWAVKDSAQEYRAADVRGSDIFRTFGGKDAYGLAWKLPYDSIKYLYPGTDSMQIDSVNSIFAGDSIVVDAAGLPDDNSILSIAGVPEATLYNIMIRKANVKKGEPDFNASRGATPAESQWMVVPQWKGNGINRIPHNTLHIHGHYDNVDFQSSTITLDAGSGVATMPYGVRKDSLLWHASMGPNTGYTYGIGPDTMNSVVFRGGDTLRLFVAGNELITEEYIVEVEEPAADMKLAFPPLMDRNYPVTEDAPGMDSILNVGYNTRIDTLLKYVEIATNATASFGWVDGVERVDVKEGDLFKVTAADGSSKEYYISVNDYVANESVLLNQIYVNGDSIEVFAPTSFSYSVTLPMGTVNLPSIQPVPQDRRSITTVTPPANLGGDMDQRTAYITVTAENDTLSTEYMVVFNVAVEKPTFIGDPFISQFIRATAVALEFYNPSSEFVDLSNYIYFNIQNGSLLTYESIFEEAAIKENIRNYMRFGYYVDTTRHDGVFFLPTDKVDAFVEPGKTFSMAQDQPKWKDPTIFDKSQFISNRAEEYGFEDMSGLHQNQYNPGHPQVLLKIVNDSVIAGTKSATDPNDFEIVDLLGEFGNITNFMFGEDSVQWANGGRREMIVRMPHVWRGNPNSSFSPEGDFGLEDEETLEWDYQSYVNLGNNGKWVSFGYGEHFANPVSVHLSTVTSTVYDITDGYIQEQSIKGVSPQATVADFYNNLLKAHKDQALKVMSGDTEKTEGDVIVQDDKLIVTSADSVNTTTYVVSVGALSSDASLFSDVYSIDGKKVEGVLPGELLSDVLANVYAASGGVIDVLDAKGQVVPTSVLSADTTMVDVLANDNMLIVVTAEDKTTKKEYSFQFPRANDEAWVLSTFYTVLEDNQSINGLVNGENVRGVLSHLIIPRDATIKIVDRLGHERTQGHVAFDDKVMVTSASGSVIATYLMSFHGEGPIVGVKEVDATQRPELTVYPNPVSDYCTIEGAADARNIVVRNILGSVLQARKVNDSYGPITVDLNAYDNGIYLISVVNNDRTVQTVKVIKK